MSNQQHNNVSIVVKKGELTSISLAEIQEQIRLLAYFNLSETAVERYEVVVKDGCRTLRKREHPIKFVINQTKYDTQVSGISEQLPSEAFFRRTKASRFNDEERATAVSTVETKECFYS